jgi:hypothetical protein
MSPHFKAKLNSPSLVTTSKQWQSAIKTEETSHYASRFAEKKPKVMPTSVTQFIVTLRERLLEIVKKKGGTEFSILRYAFLDWDADRSGELGESEFLGAMRSIGMQCSGGLANDIITFYDLEGDGEMRYEPLVKDVQAGIKHWMEHPSTAEVKNGGAIVKKEVVNRELAGLMFGNSIGSASASPSASARSQSSARAALLNSARESARSAMGNSARNSARPSARDSARSGISARSSSSQSEIKRLEEQLRAERRARLDAETKLEALKTERRLSPVRMDEKKSGESKEDREFMEYKEAVAEGRIAK